MNDLKSLYQEVIVDHNRNPRNFHIIDDSTNSAKGYNPLCGDKVEIFLKIENDIIIDASFQGCGCAISTASASLMTDALKGKTKEEAHTLFSHFHRSIVEDDDSVGKKLGKLAVLLGVKTFPSRVKCATLAWHTLESALEGNLDSVSTE